MNGEQVIKNALNYLHYVYWYGGKGQKCTQALLNTLAAAYPRVYTATYKAKCKKDIAAGRYCIDCSGLVCKAYKIPDIGTYTMATDKRFTQYKGAPENGMIVWNPTHVGLYCNGKVIEARGIDYDVTTDRVYRPQDWQRVYTVAGTTYGTPSNNAKNGPKTAVSYLQAAIDVCNGKAGNGAARIDYLKARGYNADTVQELVNIATKGAKK